MSTATSGLVSPDTPLDYFRCPYPRVRPPDTIPTYITPSAPTVIPPVWEHVIAVLMKMPTSVEIQIKQDGQTDIPTEI